MAATATRILLAVEVVPCTEPHKSEFAATFMYPGASATVSYPGLDTVGTFAEEECFTEFEHYVGIDFDSSTLEMTLLYPLQSSWALGDYTVQCVVNPPLGQVRVSESYRGSRR